DPDQQAGVVDFKHTPSLPTDEQICVPLEPRRTMRLNAQCCLRDCGEDRKASRPWRRGLHVGQATESGAAFGTPSGAAIDVARLLIVFPATHFLLHPRMLDELAEPLHRFIDRLV